jgi:hypothetical protein
MGRPALPLELQRRFWLMMRAGVVLRENVLTLRRERCAARSQSEKRSAFIEPPVKVSERSRGG